MKLLHDDKELWLYIKRYSNKRIALVTDAIDGPYATLTVNLPDEDIEPEQAFIDINNCPWAVNKLVAYGIITNYIKSAQSGYVQYPLYNINLKPLL